MTNIELFVGVDENTKNLLIYIYKHIKKINDKGLLIHIRKVTSANDKRLVSKNITRVPAMIDPNNKIHVGVQKIIGVLDKNINPPPPVRQGSDPDITEIGSNADLASFWSQEIFAGQTKKGKRIPRKDNDDSGDEKNDIEEKMRQYERNKPKHRRANNNDNEDSEDEMPRPRTRKPPRGRQPDPESDDDNVDTPPPRRRGGGGGGGGRDEDMDQKMLDAFMNNLGE